MEYEAICCTDRGIKKTVNQDSACIMIADALEEQVCMAVLCDGMGGISMGECASFSVIERFADWFENRLPYRLQEKMSLEALGNEWQTMLSELDTQLREYGNARRIKLGTTATCMLFWKQKYLLVQSGDSRAYRLDKQIMQLTEDQSFVQAQVNSGRMTEQEARYHPKRNVLTDCIGGSRPSVPVCSVGRQHSNTSYLLCSDGFVHELEKEEILMALNGSPSMELDKMQENVGMLIRKAIERGEKDNITAAVVVANKISGFGGRFRKTAGQEFVIRKKLIATEGSRLMTDELPTTDTDE